MHKKMLKLLVDNKAAACKSKIVASAKEATIYVYDVIVDTDASAAWWGGVSAEQLVKEIRSLNVETIHLRINSPGGDVFAARAMEQALRDHGAKVIAYIDGYAASAASFLMLAADEIEIASGGFVMIHNAWTMAMGNANDIEKTVGLLRKIDSTIADSYVARSGQEREAVIDWMDKETWFTAQEAVEHGFADRISDAKAKAGWNLSAYSHAPAPEAKAEHEMIPPAAEKQIVEDTPAQAEETEIAMPDCAALMRNLEVAICTA